MNIKKFVAYRLVLVSALLLAACGGGGEVPPGSASNQQTATVAEEVKLLAQFDGITVPPSPESIKTSTQVTPRRATNPSRTISLPEFSKKQQQSFKQRSKSGDRMGPVQVGVARSLQETVTDAATQTSLRWETLADGTQVTAIKISSPGALEIRLGLRVTSLPRQTVLRVYGQDASSAEEVSEKTISESIERNRSAGDVSDAGRTYWLPPVAGSNITLEVQIPKDAKPGDVNFSLPTLSHLFTDASQTERERDIGDALECNLDVTCAGSAYDQESAATVQLRFVEDGATYNCTGTTLAAADNSLTPYLLTANHCFNNQTVASTLVATFFLRSTTCNALTSRTTARLTTGATWLYSSSEADTTFVRLNSPMPAGARLAGWATSVQNIGTQAFGLHHPQADLQLYSIGSIASYRNCSAPDAQGTYSCTSASQTSSKFYEVDWTQGITEGGSSGSALWATIAGSRYVVGSLRGGTSTCTKAAAGNYIYTGTDTYGRFDVAYNAALKRWLSPATEAPPTSRSAVYRFYNASTGAHFYTTSAAERDQVIATLKNFAYEGVAFYAYTSALNSGTSPVYRFYNRDSGSHFYTISAAEKDWVIATLKNYVYEGSAWNGQMTAGGTAVPIYRFFNPSRSTHFFTISETEKNIVQTNPSYQFEGIAYYSWTTP
jgi:hypothetical protein